MSLIITATDFSKTGENAVTYACGLAVAHKAQLIIIHSYMIPVMFSDVPMPASIVDDAQHDAEEQMKKLVSDISRAWPDLSMKGEIIYGDIVDAIEEYTKANTKPWMIVVGNNSMAENSSWPDSVLIEALKNLKYPVLAVPPGVSYKPIRRICFAFDNKHTGNEMALLLLTGIVQQFNAALHVLNIQTDAHNPDIDENAKELLAPAKPDYFIVMDTNIDNAIETFIEKSKIDLLIMIPRKHSFFEGLFHISHTKAVAHHSNIPILALHEAGE